MSFFGSKRGIAVIAALLLLLFLFRPAVQGLRNRISNSIASAVGRRVSIDRVRFRILPRPGFDLEGLVIYDDPAFGAEPMIRAQDVFAAIRFRSLVRGRLEIATLSATEPSINIVRNNEGRWNLASLLERNAQIPAAPTQKAPSERRPAFPYLEASGARINFKIGQAKKSFALTDADVALWQESENSWGARLKAQPVRTDFNLTDTGKLQMNATWQRASDLHQTPLRLSMTWQNGQLGQITQLLTGKDRGWRGGVDLTANVTGTPEALAVESRAAIGGFHRYDILERRSVRLGSSCRGTYNAVTNSLADLLCEAPVRGGRFRLSGKAGTLTTNPSYDLTLSAEEVPVASVFDFLHEAKKQLPGDLTADGLLDAEFHAVRNGVTPAHLTGTGTAAGVRLSSNGGKDLVAIGDIPLTLVSEARCCKAARAGNKERSKANDAEPAEAHLRIGPASVAVNAAAPISAGGWIAAGGYRFFLRGDAGLKNLFRLENVFGMPAAQATAEGEALLDVSISGPWQGLAPPLSLGTAQLRKVRAEVRGLNIPIEITAATVTLAPDGVAVQKIAAETGSTHWSGSVSAPRHCAPACVFQFDLAADRISSGNLAEWFAPHPAKRPWYRILSSDEFRRPSPLVALQAHGRLHVARFEIKKMLATQLTTEVAVDGGKITLTALHAQLLQGTHRGRWAIDAAAQPVRYHGEGALLNVSLAQVGELMNDPWISGSADGRFDLETFGGSFRDLLANADGKLQFVMRNGSLGHVEIPGGNGPMSVHRFAGDLRLKNGVWELWRGRLESHDGVYEVSGTASAGRGIDFVFTRGDEYAWNLTGTLAEPQAAPVDRTEISAETSQKAGGQAPTRPKDRPER